MNKKAKNTASYKDSGAAHANRTQRPIPDERIGRFKERLALVVEGQSVRSFVSSLSISEGTLRSYLRGDTYPDLPLLWELAAKGGVTFQWLATGDDPMRVADIAPPGPIKSDKSAGEMTVSEYLDKLIMEAAIETAERVLAESGQHLVLHKKSRYIAAAIMWFRTTTPAERVEMVPERLKALIGVLSQGI